MPSHSDFSTANFEFEMNPLTSTLLSLDATTPNFGIRLMRLACDDLREVSNMYPKQTSGKVHY